MRSDRGRTTARSRAAAGGLARLFVRPIDDVRAAIDAQIVEAERPPAALLLMLATGVVTWWVYVPVHELLHALGCYLSGGVVTELQIAPEYGGAFIARLLPFVVAGGEHAGRLSGFDTHGSDLTYLATDALPFLLTVLIGVPLLRACARPGRPARLGVAVVLGLAPFYCVPGDYYEMGSILTTRVITVARRGDALAFAALRSDDVVRLVADLRTSPGTLLHNTETGPAALVVIGASLAVAVLLACATYALGISWPLQSDTPLRK